MSKVIRITEAKGMSKLINHWGERYIYLSNVCDEISLKDKTHAAYQLDELRKNVAKLMQEMIAARKIKLFKDLEKPAFRLFAKTKLYDDLPDWNSYEGMLENITNFSEYIGDLMDSLGN